MGKKFLEYLKTRVKEFFEKGFFGKELNRESFIGEKKYEKIKELLLFKKYKNFENLRKLSRILSFTSITANFLFYIWVASYTYLESTRFITPLLTISIIINTYTAYLFLNWSSPYENTRWSLWAWISMIFISPFGWVMLWYSKRDRYWELDPDLIHQPGRSILHLFANSLANLEKNINNSINYLSNKYPEEYQVLIEERLKKSLNFKEWDSKTKHLILAISLSLQQNKKNRFKDIILNAHWYDEKKFDFILKDPRSEIMILKYPYAIGFLIIDEFDNYQKILDFKKEIKSNLRFSPAKIICLHWGKGYKIYLNA